MVGRNLRTYKNGVKISCSGFTQKCLRTSLSYKKISGYRPFLTYMF